MQGSTASRKVAAFSRSYFAGLVWLASAIVKERSVHQFLSGAESVGAH